MIKNERKSINQAIHQTSWLATRACLWCCGTQDALAVFATDGSG